MRPISLEMEGFTSFRERVSMDFSKLDLFAITGPTGAGKTSIIDAMVYALYGCTPRIGERQVSELISQSMNRVGVLLRFSSGKNEYRIARAGKWTGKQMNTDVRLEQRCGEEWISLADSVTKAKPLIEQIIGLDFNGFTKSVVLPQGRFDEFLKGKADDRRKILSDLLELEIYVRMMRRANERYSQHKAKATAIDDLLRKEYAEATPERLSALRLSLEQTLPQLEPIELQLQVVSTFLPVALELRQARNELSKAEVESKALGPTRQTAEADFERVRKRIADFDRQLAAIHAGLKQNTYDSKEHIRLSGLLDKARRLESVLAHFEQIEEARKEKSAQLRKLDAQVKKLEAAARQAAEACVVGQKDFEKHRKIVAKLQEKYGSPEAVKSAIENQKQLSNQQKAHSRLELELKSREDERNKLEKELVAAESDAAGARAHHDRARAEFEALIRSHSAESLKPTLRPGEPCPVCEQTVRHVPKGRKHQPLDNAKRVQEAAAQAASVAEKRVANIQGQIPSLEREAASLRSRIAGSAESIRESAERLRVFAGADLLALKKDFETAERRAGEFARRVEELKAEAAAASGAFKDHQYESGLLQKEMDGYARELAKTEKEANKLRDELHEFVNAEKLKAEVEKQEQARIEREKLTADRNTLGEQLSKAKDDVAQAMAHLEGLEATRKKVEEAMAVLCKRVEDHTATLQGEFSDLKRGSAERDEAFQLDQRSRDLQSRRDDVRKEMTNLHNQIKTLEGKLARAAEMRCELEEHRTRMAVAKTLGNALQGDEFIAFIQEEAYSRLAADGSIHLKTLSDNRYSFGIEEDEFQVVDHWNGDEPRPVTTLSGGESFLASLALALALAEGLAGLSSGHIKFALESLFLDEGFGTLDPETLESVVSGIEALGRHDRLIGIISHIEALAERMPARVNVRKSVGGSTVEVCSGGLFF